MEERIINLEARLASMVKEREGIIDCLNEIKRECGMLAGVIVGKQLAKMNGKAFSEVEYNAERMPGEQ